MKKILLTIAGAFFIGLTATYAQQSENRTDSEEQTTTKEEKKKKKKDAYLTQDVQQDSASDRKADSSDTTSTRTFGTSPGTGATGAGSGNGEQLNPGTTGSGNDQTSDTDTGDLKRTNKDADK